MNRKKQKLNGNINDYPLVEVKWLDCLADNSWMSIDKAAKLEPAVAYSVGYKLIQTKSKITIFADYTIDPEDQSITVGLSLIQLRRCRRLCTCVSPWFAYH